MSVESSYIRASNSSHLEWKPTVGDVDRLVAAGLVRESLATRLIRLRADFDAVHSVQRVPQRFLRGFHETTRHLSAYAMTEAIRRGSPNDAVTLEVAAKVLDLFLDSNCPFCDGRGFSGVYGSPQIRCTSCRQSGRRAAYWKTDAEQQFASWLQSSMEGKIERALQEMRRLLRV